MGRSEAARISDRPAEDVPGTSMWAANVNDARERLGLIAQLPKPDHWTWVRDKGARPADPFI